MTKDETRNDESNDEARMTNAQGPFAIPQLSIEVDRDFASAMKIQQFLEHHGIPQSVCRGRCADRSGVQGTLHRQHLSSHLGQDLRQPGRAQHVDRLRRKGGRQDGAAAADRAAPRGIQRRHPDARLFVIEYDDFNPFLDRFRDRLSTPAPAPDRVLAEWKLWDHMDAILSLGVTKLVDRILAGDEPLATNPPTLDRHQSRDLLLLAACYDQSTAETAKGRWHRLRRTLRFCQLAGVLGPGAGHRRDGAGGDAGDRRRPAGRALGLADHALAVPACRRRLGAVAVADRGSGSGAPARIVSATSASAITRPTRCGRC